MQDFLNFVVHNWELWTLLFLLLIFILYLEQRTYNKGIHLYSPQQIVFLLNQKNALLLDIREKESYDAGHILKSVNKKSTEEKDKTLPVIVIATNDSIAMKCALGLKQKNYEHVGILKGGINSWVAADLPLAKREKK